MAVALQSFLTGYALFLGASNRQIGVLGALPALAQVLQLFSPYLFERVSRRRVLCYVFWIGGYLLWIPVLLVPWLVPVGWRVGTLLVLVGLSRVLTVFPIAARLSWFADIVPEEIRGRFFGRMNMIAGSSAAAIGMAVGWGLDALGRDADAFAMVFAVALLLGISDLIAFARVPEPAWEHAERRPSLPQILKGSGIAYFYTYKLHWQSRNRFPHSTFQWRGLDGSEVLAHIPWSVHAYNGDPIPSQLRQGWERHPQKGVYPELLFPYGWGDGGGGANDEMLGRIKRASRPFPGVPRVRIGTVNRFFADIEETNPDLPVWDGELYLETHRGVLTTQARMKRANRKSELLLRDAEILASMAKVSGRRVDTRPLREAWHTTCLHHFHDILPGSSIGQVYDEALADHQEVQETACAVVDRALGALLSRKKRTRNNALFVLNTVSWPRNDVVSAPAPFAGIKSLVDAAGRVYPVQADGRSSLIFEPAVIPPMGYAVLQCSRNVAEPGASFTVTNGKIETPLYRIRLDRDGAIRSLYDKVNKREVVAEGGAANDLQLFQDGPEREDAWNVHATYEKRRYPFDGRTRIQVVEQGPVRGVVRVTRTYRDSTIEQDLMIYARTPRIDFVTRVDWQDRQVMLKAAFPVAVRSPRATYEVQFGAVERPTHRNTSWDEEKFEVAAQRWADLSEAGYGVSLLNDCKYGHDTRDNIIRITLLRSTSWPDPNADKGRHEFTYSLFPHAGNWTDAGTVRRAAELNIPVRAVATATAEPAAVSFFEVEGPAVLDTVKPAEEGGGIVLRLYEPHGGRGEVRVRCKGPIETVTACNLVEEDEDEVRVREGMFRFSMKPFQVRTFRVARST